MATDDFKFADNTEQYDLQAKALDRRRELARALISKAIDTNGEMVGPHYVAKNPWQNFIEGAAGGYFESDSNKQSQDVAAKRAQQQSQEQAAAAELIKRLGTPGTVEQTYDPTTNPGTGPLVNGTVPMTPEEDRRRRFGIYGEGMANPSMRGIIAQQLGQELDWPQQERNLKLKAEEIATQKEAERLWREQQDAKYKRTIEDAIRLKGTPTQHFTISSGGGSGDSDGKPLSPAQEKAALELGSSYATLNQLKNTFKDEYAGDLRSTVERQFGKVLGGAAPQSTQDMTRWWSDQAMFDELPQRHTLFGAALTPTEQRSWADASINPSLAPKVIRERLDTRAKLYDLAEQRMRESAKAGGKSVKQFDAAVGKSKPTVVRTGKDSTGRKVEQLSDGTVRYAN